MKRLTKGGFTMMELLVVLLIIAILAAVAAPFFFQNANKSRASEAVSALGSIRSGERNYASQNNGGYFIVTDGATYFGAGSQSETLGVQVKDAKYFSSDSYTVDVPGAWPSGSPITAPTPQYMVIANGLNSKSTGVTAAPNAGEVNKIQVMMDQAGQVIVSYDTGATWAKF